MVSLLLPLLLASTPVPSHGYCTSSVTIQGDECVSNSDVLLADMREAFKAQDKATKERDSCIHFDKAQWQGYSSISLSGKPVLAGYRILVRSDGTLHDVEEKPFFRTSLPPATTASRTCRGGLGLYLSQARKMGTHKYLYPDGSGSQNQTVIEGDFLVTYTSSCVKWKCSPYVSRYVLAVRIGSPTYRAVESGQKQAEY